jgi:hypothetical protein
MLAAAVALPSVADARGGGHPGGHGGAFRGGGPAFRSAVGPRFGGPFVGRHVVPFRGRGFVYPGYYPDSYPYPYYDDYSDAGVGDAATEIIPAILSMMPVHRCGWTWRTLHRRSGPVRVRVSRC